MKKMRFPQNKKILVVQAHPDDADFYCGGTIAKLSFFKNEVIYLICTDGSCGTMDKNLKPKKLVKLRKKEQIEANKILHVKESIFLNYLDLSLRDNQSALQKVLAEYYRKIKPDILITFDPWYSYELHPDHTVCGFSALYARIVAKMVHSLKNSKYPSHNIKEIWLFKTSNPNFTVDITKYKNLKKMALLCHRTQFGDKTFLKDGFENIDAILKKIDYNKKTGKWVEKFKRIYIEGMLY